MDDLTEAAELLNLAAALLAAADELVPDSAAALRRRTQAVRGAARVLARTSLRSPSVLHVGSRGAPPPNSPPAAAPAPRYRAWPSTCCRA